MKVRDGGGMVKVTDEGGSVRRRKKWGSRGRGRGQKAQRRR